MAAATTSTCVAQVPGIHTCLQCSSKVLAVALGRKLVENHFYLIGSFLILHSELHHLCLVSQKAAQKGQSRNNFHLILLQPVFCFDLIETYYVTTADSYVIKDEYT